jgi:hypothetical protein
MNFCFGGGHVARVAGMAESDPKTVIGVGRDIETQKRSHYAAVNSRRNSLIASLASRHMSHSPFCAKRLRRVDSRVRNSSVSPWASMGSVLTNCHDFSKAA